MNEETIVDARGMRCPWPALRLARAMRAGVPAILITDDPAAPGEATALADAKGWAIEQLDAIRWRFTPPA